MIARVHGKLVAKGIDRIEVMTAGGVCYELVIPLNVLESLPREGQDVDLFTSLVVKEDGWQLFGFLNANDRSLFQTLRSASGVGPALALGLISALGSGRVVRAIRDRDLTTLQGVPRVGKKVAERLCVELGDKMKDYAADASPKGGDNTFDGAGVDAVRGLVALGYNSSDAERAVAAVVNLGEAPNSTAGILRRALASLQAN